MISVVLGPGVEGAPVPQDIVVRSLAWLVSAVVAGVVRDVVLAAPAGADLREIADATGCRLVEDDAADERYRRAVGLARAERVLVLAPGFAAGDGLVDELEAFDRTAPREACALLLPERVGWRPWRPRAVGIIAARGRCLAAGSFGSLATACSRGTRFGARVRSVK